MEKSIDLRTEQDTKNLAAFIAPMLRPGDVVCLYGELGTGKTYFTKQLGHQMFVTDDMSSPSFVLFNEYKTGRFPFYHLDLYRLKDEMELIDLGILDMIEEGVTVIEWPELAEKVLPYRTLSLYFHFDGKKRWVSIVPDAEHEKFFA